jgi:hypothetical protein
VNLTSFKEKDFYILKISCFEDLSKLKFLEVSKRSNIFVENNFGYFFGRNYCKSLFYLENMCFDILEEKNILKNFIS